MNAFAPLQATEPRQPLVVLSVQEMDRALGEAEVSIATLIERLSPILRVDGPSNGQGVSASAPRPVVPAFVETLRAMTDRINGLTRQMRSVDERIEL